MQIVLTPEWLTAIAAGTAVVVTLAATVIGPIVTVRMTNRQLRESREIAQRQINASVVSTSRQNWINSLRGAIADLLATGGRLQRLAPGSSTAVMFGTALGPLPHIERAILLRSRIALLINPTEEDHKRLLARVDALIDAITAVQTPAAQGRASALAHEITELGQSILKHEWERVKRGEAVVGVPGLD